MSHRLIGSALGIAVTVAFVVSVQAQAPPAAKATKKTAGKTAAPRTTDGHPDLQGVWSFATVTPMERPAELGEKVVLTDAEAADFESAGRSEKQS